MVVLDEMPRLKTSYQGPFRKLVDQETKKLQQPVKSDLPWGGGRGEGDRGHDPKDSKQHIKTQQQGAGHGGSRAF